MSGEERDPPPGAATARDAPQAPARSAAAAAAREARLAAALRANLRRRKAQARARETPPEPLAEPPAEG